MFKKMVTDLFYEKMVTDLFCFLETSEHADSKQICHLFRVTVVEDDQERAE